MSTSSNYLLAHHKTISSNDPKSRSLDISCASSYATNDDWRMDATSDAKHVGNPMVTREVTSTKICSKCPHDLKMVPFKWEEAPGKPMHISSCNEVGVFNPSSLQLPPKLQCQRNQNPLHLIPKRQATHIKKLAQPINLSLFRPSHNKEMLKKLCKYMLKTASCTRHSPPFLQSYSWSHYPPCIEFRPQSTSFHHDYKLQAGKQQLPFNDRLFFDRDSPKDLRYCASMDSPIFDASEREDEFVSRKALKFLAMEEHEEAGSNSACSSPWKPIAFDPETEVSASPCWQPSPTMKVHGKLIQNDIHHNDVDDEGFHDIFSTSSSIKPFDRTDYEVADSTCSSPSPWYLDFSPEKEEEEVHVERRGSKQIVRLVALIKLKRVISKFKRRREGANNQLTEGTMWSPTLATYLYNQQLEEQKQVINSPISSAISTNYNAEDDGRSELGSNRLQIDPNYYLPKTIRTHFTKNPNEQIYSDDEKISCGDHQEWQASWKKGSCVEEEEKNGNHNLHKFRERVSLKEQLAEFDDDDDDDKYLADSFDCKKQRNGSPPTLDARFKASACKGMCKFRNTVKVLASAIKLVLVQTEIGRRRGSQRSFESCSSKPTLNTHPPFHFNRK